MAFCTKCGHQIIPGSKFCTHCGAVVEEPIVSEPVVSEPVVSKPAEQIVENDQDMTIKNIEKSMQGTYEELVEDQVIQNFQEFHTTESNQKTKDQPQQQIPTDPAGTTPTAATASTGAAATAETTAPTAAKKTSSTKLVLIIVIVAAVVAVVVVAGIFLVLPKVKAMKSIMTPEVAIAADTEAETETELPDTDTEQEASETPAVQGIKVTADQVSAQEAASVDTGIHTYEIVVKDVTWTQAYQEAMQMGNGSHLLTIDSTEEYDYIKSMIETANDQDKIFWLGAKRTTASSDYRWVNQNGTQYGDALNNNGNWLPGEPSLHDDELDVDECYVDMFLYSSTNQWVWNDTVDDLISALSYYSGKVAYIVEYENE